MEFAIESFGGVDILVNNAVVRHFSPIESFPVEAWDAALAVNVSASRYDFPVLQFGKSSLLPMVALREV